MLSPPCDLRFSSFSPYFSYFRTISGPSPLSPTTKKNQKKYIFSIFFYFTTVFFTDSKHIQRGWSGDDFFDTKKNTQFFTNYLKNGMFCKGNNRISSFWWKTSPQSWDLNGFFEKFATSTPCNFKNILS